MTDVHALSGAYAVDALDDIERAAFERHLAECADCRAEVASLRETAALLAETTATEPPRRAARPGARRHHHRPAAAARDRRHRWSGAAVPRLLLAAAAAVVLVGAGAVVWQQPWADDTSQAPSAADAVLAASDAHSSTSLDFPDGASATVTHSDSVGKAVIETDDMPPPPDGQGLPALARPARRRDGVGRPDAGGSRPDRAARAATPRPATGAGITVEPEGGSDEPTTEPIALFAFDA